ncbi:unnamed protein product, partial [Sphenostylis stenocarpa]
NQEPHKTGYHILILNLSLLLFCRELTRFTRAHGMSSICSSTIEELPGGFFGWDERLSLDVVGIVWIQLVLCCWPLVEGNESTGRGTDSCGNDGDSAQLGGYA